MTTSVLEVDHIATGYSGSPVVRDAHLSVGSGEVVVLLGANGAGKTTTLRAISGLLRLQKGAIRLNGRDLAQQSATARARSGIAHVPEGRGVIHSLTVGEHFSLRHRGGTLEPEIAYEYFPALGDLRNRRAGLLSGGEQQMLSLGRALATRPTLLCIDELSLGLAPIVVENLLPVIRNFSDSQEGAVLLVEQHVHLALEIADRGYLMANGVSRGSFSAEELRSDQGLIQASYLGDRVEDTVIQLESPLAINGKEAE